MNSSTNPYSTHASNAAPTLNMDISSQFKANKKDEMAQKSHKELPFTGESLKVYLGQMYINLMDVKRAIDSTGNEPNTNMQDIEETLQVIDEIAQKITVDLSLCIDKLYL